jgi:hypothetical protein
MISHEDPNHIRIVGRDTCSGIHAVPGDLVQYTDYVVKLNMNIGIDMSKTVGVVIARNVDLQVDLQVLWSMKPSRSLAKLFPY